MRWLGAWCRGRAWLLLLLALRFDPLRLGPLLKLTLRLGALGVVALRLRSLLECRTFDLLRTFNLLLTLRLGGRLRTRGGGVTLLCFGACAFDVLLAAFRALLLHPLLLRSLLLSWVHARRLRCR